MLASGDMPRQTVREVRNKDDNISKKVIYKRFYLIMRNIDLIIERLKMVTDTKTDLDLAKNMGIRSNTISTWRKRNSIPYEHLDRISRVKNIPMDWFLEDTTVIHPYWRGIPLLKSIPRQWPDVDAEDIEEYLKLRGGADNHWAIQARGEGMTPLVRDGDLVIFEIWEEFSVGDLVLALDPWGELLIRRYGKRHPEVFLVSENPAYPPLQIDNRYELIGLVQAVWHMVKF